MGNNKGFDTLTSILLLVVILMFGMMAYNSNALYSKHTEYYDFNKIDLLNVSNAEVVENQSNQYNSLRLTTGFDTTNGSNNIVFNSQFDTINLTDVDEYEYTIQMSLKNLDNTVDSLRTGIAFDDGINKSLWETNIGGVRDMSYFITDWQTLSFNNFIPNGAEIYSNDNKIILDTKLSKVNDYYITKFTYDNVANNTQEVINVGRISDIIAGHNLYDPSDFIIGIGKDNNGKETKILTENATITIDYIKIEY